MTSTSVLFVFHSFDSRWSTYERMVTPKIVYWIYTAVIRPVITYAAVVWWPRVNLVTVTRQLEHLQRLAYFSITGAMRTTPTAAMELIIWIVPRSSISRAN